MTLGALLDLGIDKDDFVRELNRLNLSGYGFDIRKTSKWGVVGTDVHISFEHCDDAHERNLLDIERIIDDSSLGGEVKAFSKRVFGMLAKAEGKVHGVSPEKVHFHEVGALDSILDIVGVAICLDILNVKWIFSSHLTDGHGMIDSQHGPLPIPVPAVAEMLQGSGISVNITDVSTEMVTPTGLALLKTMTREFGLMPKGVRIDKVGYGFGKRDTGRLNALRIVSGTIKQEETPEETTANGARANGANADRADGTSADSVDGTDAAGASEDRAGADSANGTSEDGAGANCVAGADGASSDGAGADSADSNDTDNADETCEIVAMIEANIDDMSPEALGYVMETCLSRGALDVFFTSVYMKKNRPAIKLSILSRLDMENELTDFVLRETSTIGVRSYKCKRSTMRRRTEFVELPHGVVRVKVSERGEIVKYSPEYEDCRIYALEHGCSIVDVYDEVRRLYRGAQY